MRKCLLLLLLAILYSFPRPAWCARYLWCWNNTGITNNTGANRTNFYSFCTAPFGYPAKAVTHLYYYAHTDISSNKTNLRSFISDAHSKGFKVIFLDGDANWVTSAGQRAVGETLIDTLTSFNAGGTVTQRFDGIQYDVEPYGATGWAANKTTFWSTFTTLLGNCRAKVNAYNANFSSNSIYFEVAIPRWYDSDADAVTSSIQCQNLTDSVAIMDYVDTSTPLINDALTEITYADSIGKKVVVGVETQDIAYDSSSFFEEDNSYMEAQLTIATVSFNSHASFSGMAIHYYDSYKALSTVPIELSSFTVE